MSCLKTVTFNGDLKKTAPHRMLQNLKKMGSPIFFVYYTSSFSSFIFEGSILTTSLSNVINPFSSFSTSDS